MTKPELVFIPAPGISHLASMAEFAKSLLDRDGSLPITVLVIRTPIMPDVDVDVDAYTRASVDTRIRYITLPLVDPPSVELLRCPENYLSLHIESYKSHVKDAIIKHVVSCSRPLAGLILHFFCTSMIDVADELNVPSYLFFTSNAAFLGFMHYLQTHHKNIGKAFNKSDPDTIIPTYAHIIPSRVLPSVLLNKEGYDCFLKHGSRFQETKGLIINTFHDLEPYAVNALESDKETPLPPVYAVGPLIDLKNGERCSISEREKIIKQLDAQPSSSVVYLCFGSMGGFESLQLVQIANALERSGYRFLWCIQQQITKGKDGITEECTDLAEILPEGFMEKTKDRGMICGWAPQVDVLAHEAIGGFVSHCGWNSILESLWFGVPIVTWPIYAEQQINAFYMVKELGLAVELKLDYRKDSDVLVSADEIEKAIGSIMDKENSVRQRVNEMGERSRKAVTDGGSSFLSVKDFIEKIRQTS